MLGWRLDLTIILSGLLVIIYTVIGGSEAVSLTQKYQMAVIFGGMVTAFIVLLVKLPANLTDALTVAGGFKKLEAVDFSFDVKQATPSGPACWADSFCRFRTSAPINPRCNAIFRGDFLRESRLGLMFNAVLKIPCNLYPAAGRHGVCFLPVRAAAGLLQPGGLELCGQP